MEHLPNYVARAADRNVAVDQDEKVMVMTIKTIMISLTVTIKIGKGE